MEKRSPRKRNVEREGKGSGVMTDAAKKKVRGLRGNVSPVIAHCWSQPNCSQIADNQHRDLRKEKKKQGRNNGIS